MGNDTLTVLNNDVEQINEAADIVGGNSIRLIKNRIRLLYGDGYGINFTSYFNIGTTVAVQLPFIPENQGHEKQQSV
jgi:LytS/YehU family sensor histidine kinase